MTKKDLRNLVILCMVAVLLAIGTAWLLGPGLARPDHLNPMAEGGTTSWLQSPATNIARDVHNLWVWTALIITPFLFGPILVLCYVIWRFSKLNNPVPAKFHEHVPLEVAWTILPALVLVAMALPAYPVLRKMDYMPADTQPDVVVDVVGAQFYWQYHFPKYDVTWTDDGTFDENGKGNNPVKLPHDQVIQMFGTSYQVNHAWWVPAFGIKFDVIPGRINKAWFRTEQQGSFKGQCAELCGALHAFMWIHVDVVPEKEFYQWLHENEAKFPPEERGKVALYLGEDVAARMFDHENP